MNTFDLAIIGGTVVHSTGRSQVNIGVEDGRIAYVGPHSFNARETIDATGLIVLPGGVDTHVHLMDPSATDREDFPAGTRAAAGAGVTTIIEHTHSGPIRSEQGLLEKVEYLKGRSNVDFGLAAHAWTGESNAVRSLWEAGVAYFKVFTCTTHGVPGHNAGALLAHLKATSDIGARSLIHCEDESIAGDAQLSLIEAGRLDGGLLPEWRSRDAEVSAAAVAALLVRRTQAKATIAHVSHPEVAGYVLRERQAGGDLAAECCPQYFVLREEEAITQGALRKFTPPARARHDSDETDMWRLLREGTLTHISSDHAPSTLEQKADGDIWHSQFGLPGLDTTMPTLVDAVFRGHLAWEDIARVYGETPARLYGFWGKKGAIRVGFDADFAIFDPAAMWVLENASIQSKASWSPYSGKTFHGKLSRTILRGITIADGDQVMDSRTGKWLPGAGALNTPQ